MQFQIKSEHWTPDIFLNLKAPLANDSSTTTDKSEPTPDGQWAARELVTRIADVGKQSILNEFEPQVKPKTMSQSQESITSLHLQFQDCSTFTQQVRRIRIK